MRPLVLIVDDSDATAELIAIACRKSIPACRVLTAQAVSEAVALLQRMERPPALVIVDVHLGGESGFGLVKYIRANDKLATAPVVVVSANGSSPNTEKALRLGANAFLHKPASLDGLVQMAEALGQAWVTPSEQ